MNIYGDYLSLIIIARKIRELKKEIKYLIKHLINNNLFLPGKLKGINKIHFGAGNDIKDGFLNVDLNSCADIFIDVRNKLNIKSDSIEYIYSSHFVEHLEHEELVAHLKECNRILQKEGVLRLAIPDFEKVFHAYCQHNDDRLNEVRNHLSQKFSLPENLICRMDWINRAVHEFGGHKTCIDWEKIRNLLIYVGFDENKIIQTEFDENIDLSKRKLLTFYVEARA